MVTPITKQKALICCGIVLFVVLFIIVLVLALPSTFVADPPGSYVLKDFPVALGRSNLSYIINTEYRNQVYANNATLQNFLNQNMKNIGTQVWTVGSSDCSTAELRDAMPQTMAQIDVVQSFTTLSEHLVLAGDVSDLNQAFTNRKKAGVLSLDGGYAIGTRVSALRSYYNLGVRVMAIGGPSSTSQTGVTCSTKWSQTADGNASVGLTEFGQAVIKEMNRLGIAIDLSGSSNQTIADALTHSTAPVLFSSAGARSIVTNVDNLSNDQLNTAKNQDALIMVSFDSKQLCSQPSDCNITHLIETINYIANITGRDKVALGGGSLAYTFNYPQGVNTSSGLEPLFDFLHNSTTNPWSHDDLKRLSRENFVTFMNKVQARAKEMESTNPSEEFEPEADLGNNATVYPCITDWNIFYSQNPATPTSPASITNAPTTSAANTSPNSTSVPSTPNTGNNAVPS